jgi:alkylated DNA repair dioxygenase AlkB
MQQLALFGQAPASGLTFVDDATGRIAYIPEAVSRDVADAWFDELRGSLDWRAERRPMYDRIVDVPRLTAHFDLSGDLPPVIDAARLTIEKALRTRFNSVGLNLYRDGHDSVAMHNDHTEELIERSPVALLSLGSARRMRIHSKARPRRTFDVTLEPGSILVMAGASQEFWEHGIPKTRELVGPRISLAFRQRPPGVPSGRNRR